MLQPNSFSPVNSNTETTFPVFSQIKFKTLGMAYKAKQGTLGSLQDFPCQPVSVLLLCLPWGALANTLSDLDSAPSWLLTGGLTFLIQSGEQTHSLASSIGWKSFVLYHSVSSLFLPCFHFISSFSGDFSYWRYSVFFVCLTFSMLVCEPYFFVKKEVEKMFFFSCQ